eukprot:TRINITY_DN5734_c0_g2_i1.p1 TRINITY_DN5734_c0_g2~~TRINITY_DN5734_c0_g2_i1.p1  ORF type:complete len:234 (-),score=29.24 TRINITY_DN5734_c0_g2_i1:343-1002(-)
MSSTKSTASLAESIEDLAEKDLHTVYDSAESDMESTTELLSAGSAMHHLGTCIPCQFMKTKIGCNIGRICNFCHFPHEEATRNSLRKRRKHIKNQHKKLERAIVEGVNVMLADTELLSANSALHHVEACISCTFMNTKLGRTCGHRCNLCLLPHEEGTRHSMKKDRQRVAEKGEEFEQASVWHVDAMVSDTMAWLKSPPETSSCSEEASIVRIDGCLGH